MFARLLVAALALGVTSAFSAQLSAHGLTARARTVRMSLESYGPSTAEALTAPGKGLLACDESTKTVGARLETIGVENTEENRKTWRGLLFSTENLGDYVSGAILYEETLFQAHPDGCSQVEKLQSQKVVPGIKVDTG
eukprot:CAMPEP_0171779588 /NCGR_PEP_ID=MMETSP0991-20121206/59096_1 /TAXON_ID=483369 /ORGANISM="non described non described, Strain CCMP2098" /LENGTH=137 /DNA_ID=CAMNT_0012386781 /DNA_START=597 /DNA_END=1007 /DNA_ORIENTATION=+